MIAWIVFKCTDEWNELAHEADTYVHVHSHKRQLLMWLSSPSEESGDHWRARRGSFLSGGPQRDIVLMKRRKRRGCEWTDREKMWDLSYVCPSQHPYPTEDEKKQIALQTNLTLLQVNNWWVIRHWYLQYAGQSPGSSLTGSMSSGLLTHGDGSFSPCWTPAPRTHPRTKRRRPKRAPYNASGPTPSPPLCPSSRSPWKTVQPIDQAI